MTPPRQPRTVQRPAPLPRRAPRREWTTRARSTILGAQRYSRFVAMMKRTLPAAALMLIAAVVVYAVQPRQKGQLQMTFESVGQIENDRAMIKPRLTGSDAKGNPFVITADRAIQMGTNVHRVRLENVEADMTLENSRWLNATANNGLFDADAKTLAMNGGIAVYSDSGYEIHTKSANADLKLGLMRGQEHVSGQGPMGLMSADRFEIDRTKKQLLLQGNVHTTIQPAARLKLRGGTK